MHPGQIITERPIFTSEQSHFLTSSQALDYKLVGALNSGTVSLPQISYLSKCSIKNLNLLKRYAIPSSAFGTTAETLANCIGLRPISLFIRFVSANKFAPTQLQIKKPPL